MDNAKTTHIQKEHSGWCLDFLDFKFYGKLYIKLYVTI